MTFRERLADWLTRGDYSDAMIARIRLTEHTAPALWKAEDALERIHAATCNVKSGTAQKIARMAREGLE